MNKVVEDRFYSPSQKEVVGCHNLSRTFDEGDLNVEVLKKVNLSVTKGQCISIIGSSGSGKSTLLHLLGGLDKPTSGTVRLNDRDFSVMSESKRSHLRNKHLGFIYQFHHLLPEFTALENVAMPLLIRRENPRKAANEAKVLLERVGLEKRLDHKPGELSGGERQRAAVARALVTRPDCVLADEPTGNLDSQNADHVFTMMMELNKEFGTSFIIVTHDIRLAERSEIIYELNDGVLYKN